MSIRGLAHSLFVCTGILRMAALLVPGDARAEWLEEWRSELWHVWHICNQNHGPAALHRKDETIAFALGAFKDAIWLRRNRSYAARRQGFRAGTPSRCILTLAIVAAASLLIAYCSPSVWKVMRPNSYHDARDLVMISRSGFESAQYPTIQFSEYEAWRRNSHHLFTGLAFYQLAAKQLDLGTASTDLPITRASSNLFELLGVPISFEAPGMAARHHTNIFLSRSAWRKYFNSDSHIFGRVLQVDGQQAMIAGVIQDEDWRLPGHTEVWLLEDDQRLSALRSDTEGYVLAHAEPSVFRTEPDGRRRMYVRKDDGYDWFVCESLAERIRQPLSNFLFALLLACLALPATTSLPLGEYPAHRNRVPWSTRVRRWAFLSIKFVLIVAIAYCGSLDLAYSSSSMSLGTSELLELFGSFWGMLFAFRWALRDQRKRCPVCLRTLTNPARVGQFSRNFLAWNGTELVCLSGHGLLHVPDIATSWFSSQRWLYLDPSWNGLFSGGYLTSAGMF
jgi:hypothetical protein